MLKGTYQSDMVNDVVVQMSFAPDENNSFTQYISNREVDKGTFEKKENNIYQIKSDKQNFEIKLHHKDAF